jgi:hypothetical protein
MSRLGSLRPQVKGAIVAATTLSLLLFAACKYTANDKPNVDALEGRLKMGASSKEEIIAALGKPSGAGGFYLPIDAKARSTLSYYYEEGNVDTAGGGVYIHANRIFLWVFLDHDRYDGYMWFNTTISGSGR